jgi:microcystin-dependent protein
MQIAVFPAEVRMYAGASAPTGWLLCDGASYLRADYAALFAVIGTTYGSADGTHFNVPDFRGRTPIGVGTGTGGGAAGTGLPTGGTALTAVARGSWKGEETHALSSAENAAHIHKVNPPSTTSGSQSDNHTHSYSGNTGNESDHTHQYTQMTGGGAIGAGGGIPNGETSITGAGSAHKHSFSGDTGNESATHTHAVDIAEFDSGNSGSGTAHNTIQPVMGINFIIKT